MAVSITLSYLHRNPHRRKEPAIVGIAAHPTVVQIKDVLDQGLHRLHRGGTLAIDHTIEASSHLLDHVSTIGSFVGTVSRLRQKLHVTALLEVSEQLTVIGFAVHAQCLDQSFARRHLDLQTFGFVSAVWHPDEAPQNWELPVLWVGSQAKGAVAIDPAVGVRKAPGGLAI